MRVKAIGWSMRSAWRELEKEMGQDVLCPVALDDSKFGTTFNILIDGLELFYKG